MTDRIDSVARLILHGRIQPVIESEAGRDAETWAIANDVIDPLRGSWVEVQPKPDPQERFDL